ncbi:MAG: 23S rRNA (cytosine1962-C5)-methyltransferase [Pseudohongiellaceae bacterium]
MNTESDSTAMPAQSQSDEEIGVVLLKRSGVQRLSSGHPWIYPDHIEDGEADDGDVVRLEGPVGTPRGTAVLNSESRLPLRVLSRDPSWKGGVDFWQERLDQAIARRVDHLAVGAEACRWVHSEADGLPGLVIDRFGDVAVLQAGCRWADNVSSAVAQRLVEKHGMAGVLARHDGAFRRPEGLSEEVKVLAGEVPASLTVRCGSLLREVDPWQGQKTGLYLDQRENHVWAADVLPVGECLDAFSNDGAFALHLAQAGSNVLAMDSSASALEQAEVNAELNGLTHKLTTEKANVFESLREMVTAGRKFDGIVLDPPALAKRKGKATSALRAYKELALRGIRLLNDGGRMIVCSCSYHVSREDFLGALRDAAADARREVDLLEIRGAARCHPQRITFPESSYLKVVLLEARGS